MDTDSRVWLEIDLKTLQSNYAKICEKVAPLGVMAVLKANAYGLGVAEIAPTLADAGAAAFGVAELNEALQLQDIGKPVQILGSVLPNEIAPAVEAGIILPVNDLETAKAISAESVRQGRITECHFLIDTGMGRLGILLKDAYETISEATKLPGLDCRGIYSHFPMAFRTGDAYTRAQADGFMKLLEDLKAAGITFEKVHIANSDAINNFPFTYAPPYNLVRTGINLHGSFDNEGQRVLALESILTLKTRVAAVRHMPAGSYLGYGCTYQLMRDTWVATIAAGYADGLPMALSNRGYVLINGRNCPVLGRVSMDYTTVSLGELNETSVSCGDEVICLGGHGPAAITVENWAQIKGTHAYDIVCSFGTRVRRVYVS